MNTLFIGQTLIKLSSVPSTNSYAINLLQEATAREGTVIWAKEQTNGRGQRGDSWISEPSANLTLSILLFPHFLPVSHRFYLIKIAALGMADFLTEELEKHGKTDKISIKWPNDIYINNKKIAGILIENIFRDSLIVNTIVGIGCNINQTVFPSSLPNPVSLKQVSGQFFDLNYCLEQICSAIEARYLQLKGKQFSKIDTAYHELLYKKETWSAFITPGGETFKGKIKGTKHEGLLEVELESGAVKYYDLKEISFQ